MQTRRREVLQSVLFIDVYQFYLNKSICTFFNLWTTVFVHCARSANSRQTASRDVDAVCTKFCRDGNQQPQEIFVKLCHITLHFLKYVFKKNRLCSKERNALNNYFLHWKMGKLDLLGFFFTSETSEKIPKINFSSQSFSVGCNFLHR